MFREGVGVHAKTSVSSLALVLLLSGCRTSPIPNPTIAVPPNLSRNQVTYAIASAIANNPEPVGLTKSEEMTDNALRAAFGPFYRRVGREEDEEWFLESVEPDVILAGCARRNHYLRTAIHITNEQATIEIIEAENLRFDGERIHSTVVYWIQDLKARIRRALSAAALAAQ